MIDKVAFEDYLSGSKGLDKWTITVYMNYFSLFDFDEFILTGNKYLNKFLGHHNCSPCRATIKHIINYVKTEEIPNEQLLDRCNKAIIEKRTGARPHKEKPTLSYTEIERLANNMDNEWLTMMVYTCFNLALRRSELINLKINDIDWYAEPFPIIRVTGKRNKERTIKMSDEFALKLLTFIEDKKKDNPIHYEQLNLVFPKYSARRFEDLLVRTAKKLGFNQIITSHCLRRSCATYLSNKGMTIEQIRDFLGHSSITTTTMYIVKPKEEAMDKAANILNNLSNINNH